MSDGRTNDPANCYSPNESTDRRGYRKTETFLNHSIQRLTDNDTAPNSSSIANSANKAQDGIVSSALHAVAGMASSLLSSSPSPSPSSASNPAVGKPLVALVWYKVTDLRTHDHAPLAVANKSPRALSVLSSYSQQTSAAPHPAPHKLLSSGTSTEFSYERITNCLPLVIFDTRLYGSKSLSSFGFTRTGPFRGNLARQGVIDLSDSLKRRGSGLLIKQGKPEEVIPELVEQLQKAGNDVVLLTHDEFAWEEQQLQKEVQYRLKQLSPSVPFLTFWGGTLIHLVDLPFPMSQLPSVYTQFRLAVEKKWRVRDWRDFTYDGPLLPPPSGVGELGTVPSMNQLGYQEANGDDSWEPVIDKRSVVQWKGGETDALARVKEYLWDSNGIKDYKLTRNMLVGRNSSSKMSPFLCMGSLSPLYLYSEIKRYEAERVKNDSTYWLVFEILWRDYFRYYCLFHSRRMFFPYGVKGAKTTERQKDLIQPEWNDDPKLIRAWIEGKTGYPFVDANMRELMTSGWMSNRGRQVVASFLIKDMKMDWRIGAEWFESHLLDYDVGSNWGNWSYMAGVGGDPRNARYFSVRKQEAMYDAGGEFVQLWVPEVRRRKGFQPSISHAMKGMTVKGAEDDEEKCKSEHDSAAMDVDESKHSQGDATDSQRVRAEQAVYNIAPIVPLLHEPKTDEKGEFLLNKKQRKGGIGVGGYQSVGEIVNPDYARKHGDRVAQPQRRPNVGPYGGEGVKGNGSRHEGGRGRARGGGGGRGGGSGAAAVAAGGNSAGDGDAEHARQGAIRFIGGSDRYTGAEASWRAHEGNSQPSTSGFHTGSNSGGGRDPYNRAGGSGQSRGSRGGQGQQQQQRQTSMDQFVRR